MTFLEICRQVAFLSGTAPSLTTLSAVTAQTGRLAQVVNWTNVAWERIQTVRPDWQWMREEFTGSILTPTQRFAASDFSITRFSSWHFDPRPGEDSGFSLYLTATGVSDEQPIRFMAWDLFRRQFLRGTQTADRPAWFTVDYDRKLVMGPAPSADYTVRGEYFKSPQTLSANSDLAELPAENHWLLVWDALILLAENDEAVVQDPAWRLRRDAEMAKLQFMQLPRVSSGGPLA